jgi:RNA polymerase sigma-70 factor (ECF subfamily)
MAVSLSEAVRPRTKDISTLELDDAGLVELARTGQLGALEVLYERHNRALYRTALAITRDRSAAEELLQDGFVRAIRHLDRINLEPGGTLRPWLHRIVINLAYDWTARRSKAASPLDGMVERLAASPGLSPERLAERHEQDGVVAEAVAALPFKQRIVVILFYLHDMDLAEIAEELNLPEGTVKSRLYYARANLRSRLESDVRLARTHGFSYASAEPPVA